MTRTVQRAADGPTNDPEWTLCPGCRTPIYGKRWRRNLRVCPECGRHGTLTAEQRLHQLADPGSVALLDPPVHSTDVLGFVDTKPYPARLADARRRTGMTEAVLCARARVDGAPAVLAVMDFRFLGGSLGAAVGQLITFAARTAIADRVPLLLVTASGGARMQEGAISLMQMAKTSAALAELDEAGVLTVSLITDPTFGGVAASFATLTDVIIAEPGARLGFAGRRVIEQTIKQELPPNFQTAEFLLERGFVDMIVPRRALRERLGALLRVGTCRPGRHLVPAEPDPTVRDPRQLPESRPWEQVRRARQVDRPTTLDYLALAFDGFQELHGDRTSGECAAVVAGFAWLAGRPVAVIGQQKGHTPAELTGRNFGMPTPAGYRKAGRIMRLAAKLRLPVITLVDTPGAYPGALAEEQGQCVAIAENIRLMTGLPVPVLSVIIGEGGSGGALALAVANQVLICSNGVYSVISPEGCAAILWQDRGAAPTAADALGVDARSLLTLGIVDGVIPEPDGGTGADPVLAADRLRAALVAGLTELSALTGTELISERRNRFDDFGGVGHRSRHQIAEVA
jgi:acetyl-CoA carboxylase carboxyl transferase subunit beta